ncbi:MAG: MOP flippase family protein [Balneolales bacterium]
MTLREKAFSGFKWTTAGGIITSILDLGKFAILARLLVPGDFGLMAMIIVVLGVTMAYADGGTSNAVIHRQDVTSKQLSSLFWLNLMAGLALYALIIVLSPLIASFYNEGRLPELLAWAGLVVCISSLGSMHQVLLRKHLKFDTIAKIEVIAGVVSFTVAVLFGMAGQGVFALIWGQIAGTSIATALYLINGLASWVPEFRFRIVDLRGYFSFGMYQMSERSLNYLASKMDYMLIGRFLGAEVLGAYMLAYELIVSPVKRINPILNKVAFPVFSIRQDNLSALRNGYLELTKLLAVLVFPILTVAALLAPLFVPVIFGKEWALSIPLIQILALVGLARAFGNPSGSIILALGRADLSFIWTVFVAVMNAIIMSIAVRFGIFHLAGSYLVLMVIYFILGQEILINRLVEMKWSQYLKVFVKPLILSTIVGVFLLFSLNFVVSFSIPDIWSLLIISLIAFLIYLPGIWFTERPFLIRLHESVRIKKETNSHLSKEE